MSSYLHKYFLRVKIRLKVSPGETVPENRRDMAPALKLTCSPVHHLGPKLGSEGRVDAGQGQESVKRR